MSAEIDGLRNIVESQRQVNAARLAQFEAVALFGPFPPYKPRRGERLRWWLRDKRADVAGWIYPEGRDDYW